MIVSEEKGKRPRSRAPVSCLNCKRRKVRCDKGRPCTGCVKNNVGHLCVYVDPKWADASKSTGSVGTTTVHGESENMRADLQHKIDSQAKEIMCLRAQLAQGQVMGNTGKMGPPNTGFGGGSLPGSRDPAHRSPGGLGAPPPSPMVPLTSNPPYFSSFPHNSVKRNAPMTVLSKLNGRTRPPHNARVLHDDFFTMSHFRETPRGKTGSVPLTSLYSWLNIIKIDPQLTALWFRITNLQKSYHIYKTSLLKMRPKGEVAPEISRSQSSVSDGASCGHHQCPVVACEFNLMLEESEESDSEARAVKTESGSEDVKLGVTRSEDALGLLGRLQNLWMQILGAATEQMSFRQLAFLVDFYAGDVQGDEESGANEGMESPFLVFFAAEIRSLFSENGAEPRLDVGSFSSKMSDSEVVSSLKIKAVYMSMLALVVDESIEKLHHTSATSELGTQFRTLFPLEKPHAGIARKSSNVLETVLNLIASLFKPEAPADEMDNSMAALALLVALLNRLTLLYERANVAVDVRDSFTRIFVLFFETITKNGVSALWSDPGLVHLEGAAVSAKQRDEFGMFLCSFWNDILRLSNNVTFGLLPFLRHGTHVDKLLESVLVKVPGTDINAHVAFLGEVKANSKNPAKASELRKIDDLELSLQAQHLIARSAILLKNGIDGVQCDRVVRISELLSLISEFAPLCESPLAEFRSVRAFEAQTMLRYLEYYLLTVVFLQYEENGEREAVSALIPVLFQKSMALNSFLRSVHFSRDANSRYVWAVAAENFARVSHLVSGLLIRFKPDATGEVTSDVLVYTVRGDRSPKRVSTVATGSNGLSEMNVANVSNTNVSVPVAPITIPVAQKEDTIREADRTVEILESTMGRDCHPKTKIWKFYQTFIRNSRRKNPAAYAKLHAEALGAGKLLDNCPIMGSTMGSSIMGSGYETSAARMEFMKCPVFHTQGRLSHSRASTPGCPVAELHSSGVSGVSSKGSAPSGIAAPRGVKIEPFERDAILGNGSVQPGKCPFGHDAVDGANGKSDTFPEEGRKRKWPYSHETAVAEDHREPQSHFLGRIAKYTPPLCVPAATPLPPPAPLMPQPTEQFPGVFGDMDWDNLPNFNFDMMEDEALMVQLNGGDFNNPLIEGLFQ